MTNIDLHEIDYLLLRQRMDSDLDLEQMFDFVLMDPAFKNKAVNDAFNITLNDPATYMDRCASILSADKRKFEISGIDPTNQKKVEDWVESCLYTNDEQLSMRAIEPFEDCLNWFILRRGWAGSLWLLYDIGDNKVVPSIVASDPRWMTWEIGARGLKQFSYRARMGRMEAEDKFKKKLPGPTKYIDLQCVWNTTHELVYQASSEATGVTGDPLKSKEHGFGICPGVVTPVPTQPMLISGSSDYPTALSHQGESLMANNRKIFPMLNKVASIMASIAQTSWLSNVVLKSDKTEGFEKNPQGPGNVPQIGEKEDVMLWPTRDLSQALTYLFGMLGTDKQKGGLSDINYGQIQF